MINKAKLLIKNFQSEWSTDLIFFYKHAVDDIAPEVGEDEGAGDQEMEDCDLDFADCEREAEDVEAGK